MPNEYITCYDAFILKYPKQCYHQYHDPGKINHLLFNIIIPLQPLRIISIDHHVKNIINYMRGLYPFQSKDYVQYNVHMGHVKK